MGVRKMVVGKSVVRKMVVGKMVFVVKLVGSTYSGEVDFVAAEVDPMNGAQRG
jgi:hypothetical protein